MLALNIPLLRPCLAQQFAGEPVAGVPGRTEEQKQSMLRSFWEILEKVLEQAQVLHCTGNRNKQDTDRPAFKALPPP